MFVSNFPFTCLFDKNQGRPRLFLHANCAGLETVIEHEGGNASIAKHVNFQILRLHKQVVDRLQAVTLSLSRRGGIHSGGRFRGELGEPRTI